MRRPVIAGNWKMNKGPAATREFFRQFKPRCPARTDRTLAFFPPAVSLMAAAEMARDRPDLLLGVQNIYWKPEGAFTGELSGAMAREAGARFTLVGHSERRHVFGESDDDVRRKVAAAFEADLVPVLCLGEKLEERKAGQVEAVILRQLDAAVSGLPEAHIAGLLIAYEPVWAIGTGVNATPADAAAAHAVLRRRLAEHAGEDAARSIPILYGGSVKPENATELLAAADVDGLLVGGASLDPGGFARIALSEVRASG
ncbi:MAG: triose-phosphate isomerase [Gemmatimonadetes bacterium]|nr:triose-phosphate isomerase [Gemmatimonadota bacterium]